MTLGHDYVRTSSPEQARELQEQLARRARREPPGTAIRWIAGEDCSYSKDDSLCGAAVVVWDLETREEVETGTVLSEVPLPYIPGLPREAHERHPRDRLRETAGSGGPSSTRTPIGDRVHPSSIVARSSGRCFAPGME